MKEDSLYLLDKLHDINKKGVKQGGVILTKEGTKLINTIFLKLHALMSKEWKTTAMTRLLELPKSTDYSYIPITIRNEIELICKHFYSCSFTFNQRTFTVFLCLTSSKKKYIQNLVRRIELWLSMVSEHVGKTCSKTVNIYLYLIKTKKILPTTTNEQIDLIHVNTAFTTGCQPHTNVHVFREEEWFRAFIHESFHNLGLDFLQLDPELRKNADDRICSIFPVGLREIRFNETYCEMWAEVLNAIFLVYLSEPEHPTEHMIALFKKMMFFEGMFSSWQCVKILRHNNLTYAQLYDKEYALKYKEKTNGFSYYILKSIYMVHVSQFLHFCASPDKSVQFSFSFPLTSESINQYVKIVEDNHDSIKYLNGIKIMEKEMEIAKGGFFWKKTLRMSLFEARS